MLGTRLYARTALAALLALTIATAMTACTSDGGEKGSKDLASHRDPAGFSLAYPKEWKPSPSRKLMAKSRFEVLVLPKGATVPDMALDVFVEPAASSVERTVDDFITLSRSNDSVTDYRLVSRTKKTISGNKVAYLVEQTYRTRADGGTTIRLNQRDLISTTKNGDSLDVRLTCRAERCKSFSAQADAVLNSVRAQ